MVKKDWPKYFFSQTKFCVKKKWITNCGPPKNLFKNYLGPKNLCAKKDFASKKHWVPKRGKKNNSN